MILLTLPLPPSDNERLIVAWKQRRMILSKKYRDYKKIIEGIAPAIAGKFPVIGAIYKPTYENQIIIEIKFFLKDKRRDATDMLKCLLDALKGVLYDDDKWVVPIIKYPYMIDNKNPRIEITI